MQLNQLKVPSVVHGSGTLSISFFIHIGNVTVRNYLKFFNIKLRTLSESINLFNKNAS